jgi:hypothetical protein
MNKIIFLVFTFLSASTWAESKVTYCPTNSFIGIQIRNNLNFPIIACSDVQSRLEMAVTQAQKITTVDLSKTFLVIYNQDLPKGSAYSWVTSTMSVDISDIQSTDNSMAVFHHEMGHKIYFETLSKVVPEVSERMPKILAHQDYLKKCQSTSTPEIGCDPVQTNSEIQKLNDSFSKQFDQFIYITTPYNELFADIVASLVLDDVNAIAKVMAECTNSDYACEYRAFSKNTIDKFAGENPYSRFSPIRRDLWDGYVALRSDDTDKLLKELADVFIDESYSHFVEDYKLIEGMSALVEIKRLKTRMNLNVLESPTIKYGLQ